MSLSIIWLIISTPDVHAIQTPLSTPLATTLYPTYNGSIKNIFTNAPNTFFSSTHHLQWQCFFLWFYFSLQYYHNLIPLTGWVTTQVNWLKEQFKSFLYPGVGTEKIPSNKT